MPMLASLRSDRWTTSPEHVDGLTGIPISASVSLTAIILPFPILVNL